MHMPVYLGKRGTEPSRFRVPLSGGGKLLQAVDMSNFRQGSEEIAPEACEWTLLAECITMGDLGGLKNPCPPLTCFHS